MQEPLKRIAGVTYFYL